MDENRKKNRISEDLELIKRILEPLGFSDINKNKENQSGNKDNVGYDFKAKKDGKDVKIEVKSSTFDDNGIIKGIPDAFETEFTNLKAGESPKLKADYLLVIGLENNEKYDPKKAYLIPKEIVNKREYQHHVSLRVRFSSTLKTDLKKTKRSTAEGIKVINENAGKWEEIK
ncbi:MAG: hypothetical protein ACP5FQ_07580 [Thermoplasmata archaeon]